jgi:hypothetical protein
LDHARIADEDNRPPLVVVSTSTLGTVGPEAAHRALVTRTTTAHLEAAGAVLSRTRQHSRAAR